MKKISNIEDLDGQCDKIHLRVPRKPAHGPSKNFGRNFYWIISIYTSLVFSIAIVASLAGCKKDHCGPREIADSPEEFYAFGRVTNFLTGEPEMRVQLLFMDQVGGSRILKLDSTTASESNGCFYFENKRDLADLQTYLDQNPSLTVNHLNQTIRSHDKDYFYLFTQQSSDRFIGRAKLNASEEVLVQVAPIAQIRINHQTTAQINYNFRWEFQDPIP